MNNDYLEEFPIDPAGTVTMPLTLPGNIYDQLQSRNSKGARRAILVAIKMYLKNGRPVKNAERDKEIFRDCKTMRQADVAKKYKLSMIRIQQIVADQKIKSKENM